MRHSLSHRVPSRADLSWAVAFMAAALAGTVAAAALQLGRARELDAPAFALVAVAGFVVVAWRRVAPVWALAAAMAAASVYLLAGYPYGPVQLCMVIGMFEVARQRPPRIALVVCGLAALTASAAVVPRLSREVEAPVVVTLAWTAWIVLPWSLGALAHVTAAARARARRDLVARAALDERTRLTGDVHDVAGHGFAVVAMHAGVALLVLEERPDQARASLEAIKTASEQSLAQLRGMLDAVHPQSDDRGLAGVGELVDEVRASGFAVELEMEALALARDVDIVAYRVVQESLTNVLRHAGPTSVAVRIARVDDAALVQVLDGGRGVPPDAPTAGRGLTGMRRRVEAVGGRLEAGPRAGGGYQVAARLPLAGGTR